MKRLSPPKEFEIERAVPTHIFVLRKFIGIGGVDEKDVGNADETHFVINIDNGHKLGFSGETEVKYADVVAGREVMTMVVRLSGGRDARIELPLIVFTSNDRSYLIHGVADIVPGVAYRIGPKGEIDSTVMPQ